MCETYGRDGYESIRNNFPSKTLEEVKEYLSAFWKNWGKIENGHKYVERIEKGE
jgi:hypothetical protein